MSQEKISAADVVRGNSNFVDLFHTDPNVTTKVASQFADVVRDHIKEEGFRSKILPSVTVGRADLQVSVNHDTLVKIVQTEPRTRAATMSMRGQPSVVYFTAPRFEVGFYEIGSPRYEQTKQEILAYDMPIVDFIRNNIGLDVSAIEDRIIVNYSEQCCQSLQQASQSLTYGAVYASAAAFSAYNVKNNSVPEVGKIKSNDVLANTSAASNDAGVAEATQLPCQKDDIIKLRKLYPGYGGSAGTSYGRLKLDKLLITETDEADFASWTISDVGELAKETAVEGWRGNKVVGAQYIRTLKTDILRPGNIYGYAPSDFLGKWMELNKLEFWSEKHRNRFSFEAYKDCGSYIGNIAAVRKLETFMGAVETLSDTSLNSAVVARYAPVSEAELGKLNNKVAEGVTVPKLNTF